MEIEFDEKRVELLGETALSANIRFSKETGKAEVSVAEYVAYELTDPSFIAKICDEACIDKEKMLVMLDLQRIEIMEAGNMKVTLCETYELWDKLRDTIAEIPNFDWRLLEPASFLIMKFIDKTGITPEGYLIETRNLTMLLALINANLHNPDYVCPKTGYSLFMLVADRFTCFDILNKLIDLGQARIGHVAKNGKTALHVCCDCRITLEPRVLENIEFKSVDENHETALMACLDARRSDSAAQLLKNGNCNVEYVSPKGLTALIMACYQHDFANAMTILEMNPGNEHSYSFDDWLPTALLYCLKINTSESLAVARKILETQHENIGVAMNSSGPTALNIGVGMNSSGPTALILACKNKHSDIALKILESPYANLEWNTPEGSALELARMHEMHAVVTKILEIKKSP